jgi:hypothetical protein
MTPSDEFFDLEDGVIDELNGGSVLCPVCRRYSFKQTLKYVPSVFVQAEMIEKGEEWPEEYMGWICPNGCTKAQMK